MATRRVTHDGKEYDLEASQKPNGKYVVRVDPVGGAGDWMRGPPVISVDPHTGIATNSPGYPLEHDTEKGALDAAEDNVKLGAA